MGVSVVVDRGYKCCLILLPNRVTLVDLIELDMIDFGVILGMHWFHACFSSIGCKIRIVQFQFPNEPIFEWKGGISNARGKIISCLLACKVIAKGCLYHVVNIRDLESEVPPLESVPVVSDFRDFFPDDLSGIPPNGRLTSAYIYCQMYNLF